MNLNHMMTELVIELAIIIFIAKAGGLLAKKVGMPSVLGELLSGILVGPFLLGALPLPGFPHGLFPLHEITAPVSPELYGFATVASILLLFVAGLETDLKLFLKYSLKGSLVGVGGVIASMAVAVALGVWWFGFSPSDPKVLFLGVLSIATSVGITARILSDKRKIDSPEGVTILAAAVVDDVLGIIILAIVLGLTSLTQAAGASLDWGSVAWIAVKALGVWLGFSALGLIFAKRISTWLKGFKGPSDFVILSLGITFIVSGLFEQAGLAMIVGAYVTGLSLSKTDLALVLQEKLQLVHDLLVPIFFAVMGMLVDLKSLLQPQVLIFGIIFTLGAIVAKILGAGIPSLFVGFNRIGAFRIGLGMVPRGEVALIVAGIGFSTGLLSQELFGVAILMTLLTTMAAPPALNFFLGWGGRGTRKAERVGEAIETPYEFANTEITELVVGKLLGTLEAEGFFLHTIEVEGRVYRAGKDNVFFSLLVLDNKLIFTSQPQDKSFLQTMVYESLVDLGDIVNSLKASFKPEKMVRTLNQEKGRSTVDLASFLDLERVDLHLKGQNKEDILHELALLVTKGSGSCKLEMIKKDLAERETSMSTGLAHGIALPHAKTDGVDKPRLAVGLKPQGVDFQSLDGEPSKIFFVILSPKKGKSPHLQILSTIGSLLNKEENRNKLLSAPSKSDLISLLFNGTKP